VCLAQVADFWRAYEKPSGSYCYKPRSGKCVIRFGASVIDSLSFHYPTVPTRCDSNAHPDPLTPSTTPQYPHAVIRTHGKRACADRAL
jgi:hypothetical protein